jgi:hypothetical protein
MAKAQKVPMAGPGDGGTNLGRRNFVTHFIADEKDDEKTTLRPLQKSVHAAQAGKTAALLFGITSATRL